MTHAIETRRAVGYDDLAEHLADELAYVRALLQRMLATARVLRPHRNALGGLAVDDAELDRFLAGTSPAPHGTAFERRLHELRCHIDRRLAATSVRLPIDALAGEAGLDPVERDIVRVLLAPEIDVAFERAYASAWDDFSRKRCDIGFVSSLIGRDERDRYRVALRLSPVGTLARHGIVDLEPVERNVTYGFLSRPIRLAPRIVTHLLGGSELDEKLDGWVDVLAPSATEADLVLDDRTRAGLLHQLEVALSAPRPRILLQGERGAGKKLAIAIAVARSRPRCVLVAALGPMLAAGSVGMRALLREAFIRDALIYIDVNRIEPDAISTEQAAVLAATFADSRRPLVVGAARLPEAFVSAFAAAVRIAMPTPGQAERQLIWQRALADRARADDSSLQDATRFPLTGGAILSAAELAIGRARERCSSDELPTLCADDVTEGARRHLVPRLTSVATRITSMQHWDDVVMAADVRDRLRDLSRYAAQRRRVFDDWGFASKFPTGRGLSVLFYGPPGTGKTMVAGVIAAELGMELFRIDVSRLVSKWIGETEKNLARVFDEAQHSPSILLFDEADSLFARRTDVKSANDRYANLEVNYLLQRMEDFDGVTILTTNLEHGIDDAFKRRLRFRIEFPFPEPEERAELWRRMFPDAVRPTDVNWRALGAKFELAGGNIKNAVLHAAMAAAHRGDRINREDVVEAALHESREMGRIVVG